MSRYYTAFVYSHPFEEHCTHKYLGELIPAQVAMVERIVSEYFEMPRMFPRVAFTRVEYFGSQRVLLPEGDTFGDEMWMLDLRHSLNIFRVEDYDRYRPHISTGWGLTLDQRFSGYALIELDSGEEINFWRNYGYRES